MPHWIDAPEALASRLKSASPGRVGLDTEFIRERTYWPKLALVQVALPADGDDDDGILLVDPLVHGMAAAIADLLTDASILKVMHSPGEDLLALGRTCNALPAPLFDTQAAAALAGEGAGMGYQKLVERVTGIALAKGETRSDWLRRPLSPSQLEYAADDVRHLFALHDALAPRLEALGRADWLAEDIARQLDVAADVDGDDWPHLAVRAAAYLAPEAQARLLRLLRWREAHARASDRPRGWILDNELAVALARRAPADRAALDAVLAATPKAPRSLAGPIWSALDTPLDDEADMPLARDADADKATLRAMQDAVAQRTQALGLPDGVLASRRLLQAMLDRAARGLDPWPGALDGWRRAELEPVLAPLLQAGLAPDGARG
ncbi:ribonuclease D [Luteimonas pelagia]